LCSVASLAVEQRQSGMRNSQAVVAYAAVISFIVVLAVAIAIIFGPAVTRLLLSAGS
jgi:hypothetical protein